MKQFLRRYSLRRWVALSAVPLVTLAFAPFVVQADRNLPKPTRPVPPLATPRSVDIALENQSNRLLFEENRGQHDGPVRYKMFGGSVFLTDRAEACMLVEVGREPLWRPTGKAAQNPLWRKVPASRPVYRALRMQPVERETGQPVPPADSEGLARSPIKLTYCKGERTRWRSQVPLYRQVVYHNVYAGIDLVYYPKEERLTYDFRVAPGADPNAICLNFDGADRLALDREGNLHCLVGQQTVAMQKPTLYQEVAGERRIVPGRFVLDGKRVAFEVGAYDRNLALVIDPVLPFYSTYLGGSQDDEVVGVTVGRIFNRNATTSAGVFTSPDTIPVFVAGTTFSPTFPVPVGSGPNANTPIPVPDVDIFVARFEFRADGLVPTNLPGLGPLQRFAPWNDFTNGSQSDFTYDDRGAENGLAAVIIYGGSGDDVCTGAGVNAQSPAVEEVSTPTPYFRPQIGPAVVGYTTSTNFPTGRQGLGSGSGTTFQSTFGGGNVDAVAVVFPFCLDPLADNLTPSTEVPVFYATYIGGNGDDIAWACAAEQRPVNDFRFVVGGDTTGNLPVGSAGSSPPLFDGVYGGGDADGFVARFNPGLNSSGAQRRYLTYFGGNDYNTVSGISVFVSSGPRVAVTGLTFSNPDSTFINGSTNAVASTLSGATRQGDSDAFVAVFRENTGPVLDFSTYLGGNSDDWGFGIQVGRRGVSGGSRYVVNVAGLTTSTTNGFGVFSLTGALSASNKGGRDAFVAQIRWDEAGSPPTRTLQYFGYLGGAGNDDALTLATSNNAGAGNSIVYVGGISEGPASTLFTPVGIGSGLPSFANDLLYPATGTDIPTSRGFLARISPVNETGTTLPATLQNLVNVGGRNFTAGQPIQVVHSIAPYLVPPSSENEGVLFFAGASNATNVLPSTMDIPPAPYNVFQPARANNTSDRKDGYLGSVRLTP